MHLTWETLEGSMCPSWGQPRAHETYLKEDVCEHFKCVYLTFDNI